MHIVNTLIFVLSLVLNIETALAEILSDSIVISPASWKLKSSNPKLLYSENQQSKNVISAEKYRNYVFSGFDISDQDPFHSEIIPFDTTSIYDSTGSLISHKYKTGIISRIFILLKSIQSKN